MISGLLKVHDPDSDYIEMADPDHSYPVAFWERMYSEGYPSKVIDLGKIRLTFASF